MNDLAVYLAAEARRLGLESDAPEHAPPEAVQTFAQLVLHELAALGLIQGNEELGCWAAPRPGGH
ncbi:hypothetical protein [Deinococcus sp. AJ005]|uniref:hypothetical protein n=1 Tax=Deinococcus sp. AJ005 TaxID=2652443 RepID=UPI001CF64853|nr:hypothetical protein [Deinococcus sp. AJ005]